MPTFTDRVETAVAKLEADAQIQHSVSNGLANETVTTEGGQVRTVANAIATLMATVPRGAWATTTAYSIRDLVTQSNVVYICVVGHTSGTFATDLAAGKWAVFSGPADEGSIASGFGRQRRGGTTAAHASFTGLLRELTVDTTKRTVVVHDGSTAGGVPLARECVIDVRTFGAKGDGVTDDWQAITDAVALAVSVGNGCVYVPKGIFFISKTIMIENGGTAGITFCGDGAHATQITFNPNTFVATNASGLYMNASGPRCVLRDFNLVPQSPIFFSGSCVRATGNGFLIQGLWCGGSSQGIDVRVASNFSVSFCVCEYGYTGFYFNQARIGTVLECETYRNVFFGYSTEGAVVGGSIDGALNFVGCSSESDGYSSSTIGESAGWWINTGVQVVLKACTYGNETNDTANSALIGVQVYSGSAIVSGCKLKNLRRFGVLVQSSDHPGVTVTDTIIQNVNTLGNEAYTSIAGIAAGHGCESLVVGNVTVKNCNGPGIVDQTVRSQICNVTLVDCANSSTVSDYYRASLYVEMPANYDIKNVHHVTISNGTGTGRTGVYLTGNAPAANRNVRITDVNVFISSCASGAFATSLSATNLKACDLRRIGWQFDDFVTTTAAAPEFVGQIAVSGGAIYMGKDTSGTGDWKQISN